MLVDISVGEVIDKLSILDIKKSKIKNSVALVAIEKEQVALSCAQDYLKGSQRRFWYSLLVFVNTRIWELTDEVKSFEWSSDPARFASISNSIFNLNQQRFRIKERFNKSCSSDIQEQKSYAKNKLAIRIDSMECFNKSLAIINEYSLRYDTIILVTPFTKEVGSVYNTHPYTIIDVYDDISVDVKELKSEFTDNSMFLSF